MIWGNFVKVGIMIFMVLIKRSLKKLNSFVLGYIMSKRFRENLNVDIILLYFF